MCFNLENSDNSNKSLLTYFSSIDNLAIFSHGDAWTKAGK